MVQVVIGLRGSRDLLRFPLQRAQILRSLINGMIYLETKMIAKKVMKESAEATWLQILLVTLAELRLMIRLVFLILLRVSDCRLNINLHRNFMSKRQMFTIVHTQTLM